MSIYKEILELRKIVDNSTRGYKFEQAIRELLPWDRKPPIALALPNVSEQLDAIFIWKNYPYLIECKAKSDTITPGSSDWEDFELKIRKRKNNVFGIFCSLGEVSEKVYANAEILNREGHSLFILAGDFWEELEKTGLPIIDLLEYMQLFGKIKFLPKPPNLNNIKSWFYDKESVNNKLSDIAKKYSSTFLRRYKLPNHEILYVRRDLDIQFENYIKENRPNSLKIKEESKEKQPRQITIIRDFSGAGKTTFAVEAALQSNLCFSVVIAANEEHIDEKFTKFFTELGNDCGLFELVSVNKPIVFFVDSLDEASFNLTQKRHEILSILRYAEDYLSLKCSIQNLSAFPIMIAFSIREEYWRDWEYLFEGRRKNEIRTRISSFSEPEFDKALKNYSIGFDYKITNPVNSNLKRVLSVPINLQIFSEAHKHEGNIEIFEAWESGVLIQYFNRKQDDIGKRNIIPFRPQIFIKLICNIAYLIVEKRENKILFSEFNELVGSKFNSLTSYEDEIIIALTSEHILVRDIEQFQSYRFRHSRFIEFLLAMHIVSLVHDTDDVQCLDMYTQIAFDSGMVLMFRIHEDIKTICKVRYPNLLDKINKYYGGSTVFMSRKLSFLRASLAVSPKTDEEDLNFILKNIAPEQPDTMWDAFFILTAKANNQGQEILLHMFDIVWATNECRTSDSRFRKKSLYDLNF